MARGSTTMMTATTTTADKTYAVSTHRRELRRVRRRWSPGTTPRAETRLKIAGGMMDQTH